MRQPNDVGTTTLNELMDGDAKAAFEHMRATAASQHPMAKKLFADFKPGDKIMSKIEAYAIGNQLNAMLLETLELKQEMEAKFEIARETVARLTAEIRQLRGEINDECPACNHSMRPCSAVCPGPIDYLCTRAIDHGGDHIACGDDHRLATWGPAETPLTSADRETESAIDDELARGAGK